MFKNLMKAIVGVAVLPVDIVKDAATLCGELTDEESATKKRLEQIGDNIDEAFDPDEVD